jgi:ABC-2 type transport system ATP-binding protein
MLEISGVIKSFGSTDVLRGVELTVPAGRITGLVGANGAGKSTLIAIATGLLRPDSGRVTLAGIDVLRHRRRAARHLGLAPQELGLYPTLSVAENLAFAGRISGLSCRPASARARESAELFALTDCLHRRAEILSGGQKRRLHTAMALLHRPAVLFLDEPTVGADVPSRSSILDVVRVMAAEGTAVVYTTHYLAELETLDAHVAVLHDGRFAAHAPLAEMAATYGGPLEQAYLAITGSSLSTVEDGHALAA